MSATRHSVPAIMAFASVDPTGGSGLAADVETIASLGGHPLPVACAITVQDTSDVKTVTPVDQVDLIGQARAVLNDIDVKAFKVGYLGSTSAIEAVHTIVVDHPEVPLVLDPICSTAGDGATHDDEVVDALASLLVPHARVATPNLHEARLLAPEADSPGAMAQQMLSYGCEFVLLSGTDARTRDVENYLYGGARLVEHFRWERLAGGYRGAGCTLSSAIATLLGHGVDVRAAVHQAQQYTWDALASAWRMGGGQLIPDRLHWAADKPDR